MADDINILVIDSDPSLAEAWAERVKGLGFSRCSSVTPSVTIDELAAVKTVVAAIRRVLAGLAGRDTFYAHLRRVVG